MSRNLNSGIRGGLWERKHILAMGQAVWLFGWLVHRQTTQKLGQGLVYRGKPLTYRMIAEDMRVPERTVERWMGRLRRAGYIQVKHSVYSRMVVRILNAKKFRDRQLGFAQLFPQTSPATMADIARQNGGLKERTDLEQKEQNLQAPPPVEKEQEQNLRQLRQAQAELRRNPDSRGARLAHDEALGNIRRGLAARKAMA